MCYNFRNDQYNVNNTSSAIKSQNNDDSECRSALLGAASE